MYNVIRERHAMAAEYSQKSHYTLYLSIICASLSKGATANVCLNSVLSALSPLSNCCDIQGGVGRGAAQRGAGQHRVLPQRGAPGAEPHPQGDQGHHRQDPRRRGGQRHRERLEVRRHGSRQANMQPMFDDVLYMEKEATRAYFL